METTRVGSQHRHTAESTAVRDRPIVSQQQVRSKWAESSRYEAVIERGPDATIVAASDGRIQFINRQTEVLFGYAREELLGQWVELLIPERFHTIHRRHRMEFMAAPRTRLMGAALALFGRRQDGSEFPVEVSLAPLDEDGESLVIASIRDVSAVHRGEVAQAQAEQLAEQLSRIFDAMVDGLLVYDAEGRVLRTNAAARRILGMDAVSPDLYQHPVSERVSLYAVRDAQGQPVAPEDWSVQRILRGEVLTGTDAQALQVQTPDGRQVDLRVSGAPLRDGTGHVIGAVCVYRDDTERNRLAVAAQEQAQRLAATFGAITDAVLVYDREGNVVLMNPAARHLIGLPEFPSLPPAERAARITTADEHGRRLPKADWPLSRLLRGETLTGVGSPDFLVHLPDGRRVHASFSGAPLRDADGTIVGAVQVIRDETTRRQLEQDRAAALRRSEAWFRTMANTAPVLLWVTGTDALVTFVNDPWLRFTGRTLEQELGNGWAEGVHPDDYQRCLDTYLTAFRARQSFTMEYRLRRFDGEYRWILDNGVPRYAPDGAFEGYIGSAIDVTEREQLKQGREQAEARELAASEVAQHLDQFFAMASHDIRSPLTALVGSVELARIRAERLVAALPAQDGPDAKLATRLMEALDNADGSSGRLLRLVTLLFDVAQARAGTLTVTLAPCDLVALVREQVAAQQVVVPSRTIELHLPDQPVEVVADADRLGQVLTNYLTNALKYSPEDQPVAVQLELQDGLALVAVRDHGPGLPSLEQRRVWEPSHRVPGVAVQGSAGGISGSLGLGLHICKRLLELHPGGQVGVDSVVGQGSTFWFTLRLADGSS